MLFIALSAGQIMSHKTDAILLCVVPLYLHHKFVPDSYYQWAVFSGIASLALAYSSDSPDVNKVTMEDMEVRKS